MLKLLEDTPNHVFFFLCTTDPQKLLPTIITRCTEIKLKPLSPTEVKTAVERAIRLGKLKVHPDTIDTIINEAEGSARKALVLLDQVKDITDPEEQSEAVAKASHRAKGIELAKLLVNPRCQWAEVGEVLKNLDDEVEGVRHLILSYCNKILIGGGALAPRCAFIIDRFQANFFDSKAAGLTLACWEVISHFGKR
jgi:DNA polymerase III delta prime subunit